MIDIPAVQALLSRADMETWAELLPVQIDAALDQGRHGDFGRWQYLLQHLPDIRTGDVDLRADRVRIGSPGQIQSEQGDQIYQTLRALQPWRKGPYEIFGIHIDTEWRSDWKWQRLQPHITPLAGRKVLDVGCGNGYHLWRMAGEGAEFVLGIDPSLLFLVQFSAIKKLFQSPPDIHLLPLGIEALPANMEGFDTVFSMGVLYHRRSPVDHLLELKGCLRAGGELVLETLVMRGNAHTVLVPGGRYAKMRNVWFIPSTDALVIWLQRSGFMDVRVVDVSPTTIAEQRSTDWMAFESLADFLDPEDSSRTVEGYSAPVRAVVLAKNPG